MKRNPWMAAGLLALSMTALTVNGCTSSPSTNGASSSSMPTVSASAKVNTYKVGDVIKQGDYSLTVNNVRFVTSQGGGMLKPKDGNIYMYVDATVENGSNKAQTISSILMFAAQDGDGYKFNVAMAVDAKGQLDGAVDPASKIRGELCFEVPAKAKGLKLLFTPNPISAGHATVELGDVK